LLKKPLIFAYPNLNVHLKLLLWQSLRRELLPHGVMVTLANIGAVRYPHQYGSTYDGDTGGGGCVDCDGELCGVEGSNGGGVLTGGESTTCLITCGGCTGDSVRPCAADIPVATKVTATTTTNIVDSNDLSFAADGGTTAGTTNENAHTEPTMAATDLSHAAGVEDVESAQLSYTPFAYSSELPSEGYTEESRPPQLLRTPEEVADGLSQAASFDSNAEAICADTEARTNKRPLLHYIPGL